MGREPASDPGHLARDWYINEFAQLYVPGSSGLELFVAAQEEEAAQDLYDFSRALSLCQSPIEELFLAALATQFRKAPDLTLYRVRANLPPDTLTPRNVVWCTPQVVVGRYRLDFAIVDDRGASRSISAIECDGHEFHQKTKEQVQHDRARDRWLTTQGIAVLRFTGSEIFADPLRVAGEVMSWLENR